jgi:hypothetical protein
MIYYAFFTAVNEGVAELYGMLRYRTYTAFHLITVMPQDDFMTGLSILFATKDGGSITADETKIVDTALSQACSSDIPDEQIENVVEYLDSNLLYNCAAMPTHQAAALEQLRSDLEARR